MRGTRSQKPNLVGPLKTLEAKPRSRKTKMDHPGPNGFVDQDAQGRNEPRISLQERSRPQPIRSTPHINAHIAPNANFKLNFQLIAHLPTFHGHGSEEPYRYLEEFKSICDSVHYANIPQDVVRMKYFPFSLKDRAKEWLNKLPYEVNTWVNLESSFLNKYYSIGKTNLVRKAIREFRQGPHESFHEAWERMKDYTRTCPHHGIEDWDIVQIFYGGLDEKDSTMVDMTCGGKFMRLMAEDAQDLFETLSENCLN